MVCLRNTDEVSSDGQSRTRDPASCAKLLGIEQIPHAQLVIIDGRDFSTFCFNSLDCLPRSTCYVYRDGLRKTVFSLETLEN